MMRRGDWKGWREGVMGRERVMGRDGGKGW